MIIETALLLGGLFGYDEYVGPRLRRGFHRRPIGLPAGGPQSDDAGYMAKYRELETKFRREVEQRQLEEADNSRGACVWFSRYTEHGRLRHWVLAIDNIKYELRRNRATGTYECKITRNFDIGLERRRIAREQTLVPTANGHYICLIGWTRLNPRQIEQVCAEVRREFGEYELLWNNCHDFLRRLAERVVSECALDWSWFYDNVRTPYQEGMRLPDPPPSLVERQQNAIDNAESAVAFNVGTHWPGIEEALSQPTAAHPAAAKSVAAHPAAAKSVAAHSSAAHAVAGHSAGVAALHLGVAGTAAGAAVYGASNGFGGFGGGGC